MSLTLSSKSQDFDPIPEGVQLGTCYQIVDIGTQYSEKYKKNTRNLIVTWELPDCRIEVERDGKKVNLPRAISNTYGASLNKKATLRQHLVAWRGRDFTIQEEDAFDIRNILGKSCQLQIIHKHSGENTYANIATIMGVPPRMQIPPCENEQHSFDINDLNKSLERPDWMPEWIWKKVIMSEEYAILTKAKSNEAIANEGAVTESVSNSDPDPLPEDDVPF